MIAAQEIADRTIESPEYLGVDDIARSKGHIYDTVISDLGRRKVLAVIRDRRTEDIKDYLVSMQEEWRNSIQGVSINMSRTFKAVVLKYLPEAVIVVDRFNISAQLHKRVD